MMYDIFARFYDQLTENVDYDSYAGTIDQIFKAHGFKINTVLDIACGTGSLALKLADYGYDMICVDSSDAMLSAAQNKMSTCGKFMLVLCQDMDKLDLYDTVDGVVCTLDSFNHVMNEKTLDKIFKRISLFMNKGGVFLFDVNTSFKHREILGNNTFVYDMDDLYCVWQNFYEDENDTVNIELDFFVGENGNYQRYSEDFSERIYTDEFLKRLLKKYGFELMHVYDDYTFNNPHEETQRLIYVARKI